MFQVCLTKEICEPDAVITTAVSKYNKRTGILMGLFGDGKSDAVHLYVRTILNRMKVLAKTSGDHLFILGLGTVLGSGMMSYPNFNGDNKAISHPDVYALALIAELAGIDLRIIVLQRSAQSILASTTRRGFGGSAGTANEPKILIDNAAALNSQLELIDKRFFHCMHYEDLATMNSAGKAEFVSFVHPSLGKISENMFAKVKDSSHSSPSKSNSTAAAAGHGRRLRGSSKSNDVGTVKPAPNSVLDLFEQSLVNAPAYYTMQLEARLRNLDQLCHRKA